MSAPSDPDLVKVTEVFLIPSSFLVAALGTADSNPHRALISLLALLISVMWWVCSREALAERKAAGTDAESPRHSRRVRILFWLPVFFMVGWSLSLVIHSLLWNKPMGHS
jgi:hypothetical protein